MRPAWPVKDPAEALVVSFNFTRALNVGETIGAAEVTDALVAGPTDSPSTVLSGSPSVSGGVVLQ